MNYIIKVLDTEIPCEIVYYRDNELKIRYAVHGEIYTTACSLITGEEIPNSFRRPVFAPFENPFHFNLDQLGNDIMTEVNNVNDINTGTDNPMFAISGQEINTILTALGEIPGKIGYVSMNILQNVAANRSITLNTDVVEDAQLGGQVVDNPDNSAFDTPTDTVDDTPKVVKRKGKSKTKTA